MNHMGGHILETCDLNPAIFSLETTLTLPLSRCQVEIGLRKSLTAGYDQPPIYGLDQYHVKLFISSRIYN